MKDMELREAASLTLRTIGDTLRHVTMRDGERKALEEVSDILRRALPGPTPAGQVTVGGRNASLVDSLKREYIDGEPVEVEPGIYRGKAKEPLPPPHSPSRGDLLEKYAGKPVTRFLQLDGFSTGTPNDDGMPAGKTDEDGDWTSGGVTHELMSGGPNVRILITPETTPGDALRLLGKLAEWYKTEPTLGFDLKDKTKKETGGVPF